MILYLDSSVLVKRYVQEAESAEVLRVIEQATSISTSLITRAEMSATFAKAVRMDVLSRNIAESLLNLFRTHWNDFERIDLTEDVVTRADDLAWQFGLRGYDAVHLATAMLWHESLHAGLTFATYDKKLWNAAQRVGLESFPQALGDE